MKQFALAVVFLAAVPVAAQKTPSFEVASVKPAQLGDGKMMRIQMGGDPGRINYQNVSLKQLVTRAFGVKDYQVEGPGWIATERYDVTATMPENTPKETVQLMLQNLLAERFRLTVHRENKELPAYVLLVAKGGPKLKESEDAPVVSSKGEAMKRGIMMGPGRWRQGPWIWADLLTYWLPSLAAPCWI